METCVPCAKQEKTVRNRQQASRYNFGIIWLLNGPVQALDQIEFRLLLVLDCFLNFPDCRKKDDTKVLVLRVVHQKSDYISTTTKTKKLGFRFFVS
jgi:hypothetical protein